jgi:hypothetical protein
MNSPYEYNIRFITIRILCPKTHKIHIEAQRTVDFIQNIPDWNDLDSVVATFLEANDIDYFTRLETPEPQAAGGWVTHAFDMGCPRLVWVLPDPVDEGGS